MTEPVHPAVAIAQSYSPRPLTEGEKWTVMALHDLRRRRYTPRAWVRFLADALTRSRDNRAARPALRRQADVWGAVGAAGWVVAGRTSPVGAAPGTMLGGLAWWLAVWKMLDWHLGMAEGGDGIPRERLSPADAVTLARFWLVPLLPASRARPALLATVIAAGAATDVLDGRIARRHGRTRLGRDLDSTADLVFLLAAGATTAAAGRLPTTARLALYGRHLIGVTLAAGAVFGRARRPAVRARPWGGGLRFGGLLLCAAGQQRAGEPLLVVGCLVPPRSTAPERSRA